MLLLLERHEIVDGSAKAGRDLLPKWLPADQVLSLVVV